MTGMANILALVFALPLAVWCLAALYALIDGPDLGLAIRRICLRIVAVLVFVVLFGNAAHTSLIWAFGLVVTLHLLASVLGRWLVARGGFNSQSGP